MDVHTPEQRSYNMSRIRSKNTKPERILIKALRDKGIYFTTHRKDVCGKPDIAFKRKKIAIFVDSDFWHGKKHLPKSNQEFWIKKLERNRQRDEEVNTALAGQGWLIIRISDTDVKKNLNDCIYRILIAIGRTDLAEEPEKKDNE